MAAHSTTLPILGQIVGGKYVLKELIGQGGMGSVFAAEHTGTGKEFALKIMLADPLNQEAMDRFKREARAAGKLVCENVVDVIDVAEENGYAFMVLELLRGDDLGKVLDAQRGALPVSQAVGYVMQALDGIAAAHAQGIVHRDLKPSNLFRARRPNGGEVVKVLDFGISKVSKQSALDEKPEQLTSTKAMLGSPLYMSPEQLRSSKTVDHRADIWAVGVILYELLTNTVPFHGDTLGELFAAILDATPVAPSSRNPSLPPGLDAIILRCLRLRADERYASCADLKRELAPFASAQGHTMLASTAFMPGAPSGFPQGGRVTGPAAMTPPGGGFQHPQQVPMGAAATGSGVHPPVVKAMGPMSSTPQPGWGNTTGAGVPKSNGPIVAIGALAALLVLGAVGGAMALYATKHKATAASSASAPSETPPEPPPPASVVTAPPPPATGTAPDTSASTSASVATNNGKPPLSGHGPKTPPVKDPPKAQDPPKIAETPPPPRPPPPATATKPPSGTGLSPELSR